MSGAWLFLAPLLCGFTVDRKPGSSPPAPIVWPTTNLSFRIDRGGVSTVTDDSDLAAVYQAFAAWNAVSCSPFTFSDAGATNGPPGFDDINSINFIGDEGQWNWPDGALGYAAREQVGGVWTEVDVLIDDFTYAWSTTGALRSPDLQGVLTHELGHALGLYHSAIPAATMYYVVSRGRTNNRTLSADDIAGLCYLYPAASVPCETNADCPAFSPFYGANATTVCSGGSCVVGQRPYGEDCYADAQCLGGMCRRFKGAPSYDPGVCTQACPCPGGDVCASGICAPRFADCADSCGSTAPPANDTCGTDVDGNHVCLQACVQPSNCQPDEICFEPVSADDAGLCRRPGPGAIGTPCANPSDCVTLLCGVDLDGVARCADPGDPPEPPPDTGGQPDGGAPDGGAADGGDAAGADGGDSFGADPATDDESRGPMGTVDGGCAASTPSFALVMGAIVVALFVVRRAPVARKIC